MRQGASTTLAVTACLIAVLIALTGCGGSGDGDDSESLTRAAPPASDFPKPAAGQSLEQVLSASSGEGPVVTPAQRVLRVGDDRFAFGVFTLDKQPIDDAQVAIYAAPGRNLSGPAIGPFPARIEDLGTDPEFTAQSTSQDPDSAKVAYVTQIPLDKAGPWTFGALTREGDGSYKGSLLATPSLVGQYDPVGVGEQAPVVDTPLASEVTDISQIDTRTPPSDMHDDNLADVLGKKPVVLLFATPALCQSRICGPVVDVAEQVKREYGDRVAFIHMEVYNDNDASMGVRPQMRAYRLPSEPWLFVIDRQGKVTAAIEGAFSVGELTDAVSKVAE